MVTIVNRSIAQAISDSVGWDIVGENYDHARPFPPELVLELFQKSQLFQRIAQSPTAQICEPAVGTGRLLIPLALHYPGCTFHGFDQSLQMLEAARNRSSTCNNIFLTEGDLNTWSQDQISSYRGIVLSSVLHVVPNWRDIVKNISTHLPRGACVFLVGEEADLYNEALNREPTLLDPQIDPELRRFWAKYRDFRREVGAPDTEASQVGCKWDVHSANIVSEFELNNFTASEELSVQWKQRFTLESLLNIVRNRSFSSIFTLEEDQHSYILNGLTSFFGNRKNDQVDSRHLAVLKVLEKA